MAAAKADGGIIPQVTLATLDEGGLSSGTAAAAGVEGAASPTEPDTPRTAMRKMKKPAKAQG